MKFYFIRFFLLVFLLNPFFVFTQSKKPNIIFILTDDQRWDAIGVAGNQIIKTPQIDAIAKAGTYFKNAFSTTPICAASRASILTALYEQTHGYTFQKPRLKKPYTEIIYPKILKEHGYHVGFYGKLGVIIDSASQYFDKSDFYDRSNSPDKAGYFYKKIGNDTVHLTQYSSYQAQNFIKEAPLDKPFCLSVSFSAPHGHDPSNEQYFWQEKSDSLYKENIIPKPLLNDSFYFNKLPLEVREGYNRTRWNWRFDTPEKYQSMVKGYYRMITEIDNEIGEIRKLLKEKGIEKNTIIIIMGDNGYFLGDRQLADKWLMYDVSIRIPLIIYDPRIKKPSKIDAIALNIDIPKTILSMAGITPPKLYQGKSLLNFIKQGNILSTRKSTLIEHLWNFPEIPSSEGIRNENWKYFRYRFINAPEELYNLANDPLEKKNLAKDIQNRNTLLKLRKECEDLKIKYQLQKLCIDDDFIKDVKF